MSHRPLSRRSALQALSCLPLLAAAPPGWSANTTPDDPLQSVQWAQMKTEFLGKAPAVFDARVKVVGPRFAEDPMSVPISVDASALLADGEAIQRMLVFVERNPIRKVLEFVPTAVAPKLTFRFKLEQASPVRVAVLDGKGLWHVGSTQVDASGGGCTVSGASRADGSWSRTLNHVQARYFPDLLGGNATRLRLRVMHPMDTGLVAGIPAFYLERLQLQTPTGEPVLTLALFEPVSENPTFSFDFPASPPLLQLRGVDNNGNKLAEEVRP